ncbi:MAG: Maf family protein [Patescibacteria group bacterium]|jgi:predicted house-cleaning NTP pyrophosphatase (Maf/HAM1 superfamily)
MSNCIEKTAERPVYTLPTLFVSSSEQKVGMLVSLGVDIQSLPLSITPSEEEWQSLLGKSPVSLYGYNPELLAYIKAEYAHHRYPERKIVASDTIKLVQQRERNLPLEKPKSPEEAVEQVLLQAGNTIIQKGALAFWNGRVWQIGTIETAMRIKPTTKLRAQEYVRQNYQDIQHIPGSLPILNDVVRNEFYEDNFPVTLRHYSALDNSNTPIIWEETISIKNMGIEKVFEYINGFAPSLLSKMGLRTEE